LSGNYYFTHLTKLKFINLGITLKNTKNKLKIFFAVAILFICSGFNIQPHKDKIIANGNLLYLSNTVIVKLKNPQDGLLLKVQNLESALNQNFPQFKFSSVKQIFKSQNSTSSSKLDNIMILKYGSSDDPQIVASKIKQLSNIEWAEPKYVRKIILTPNDPSFGNQYYLNKDYLPEAWNITQGDTNIVIGIVDTGVDWPHPDLYANIWHNWKDIKSNWASDTDGIVGDSIGWDFGGSGDGSGNPTPDSNPIEDVPFHGTLVAGVASAVTNNGIGVSGVGYNCKIMPIKAAEGDITDPSTGDPLIVFGFEGIKYAADNGAKVINCSWGGSGFSNFEQAVINYAVSKGALVVAAAGNDNSNEDFYPADYEGVLSVAATDTVGNKKSYYSNYGSYVDVCAPGNDIYNTFQPNTYENGSGTSFASPQVAGLAALVFSKFPNYTPLQVAQQIRVNCDNIDAENPGYQFQLGNGRINAYKALTDTNSEAVRATNIQLSDSAGGNNDGYFEPGETISVKMNFVNYLKPASNVSVNLQSMSQFVVVKNGSFNPGTIKTLDSTNNYSSPFTFTLADSLPLDSKVQLRLNFSDGSYSDFQDFEVYVNPSYKTQAENNVSLTITSKGDLGFNDYPTNIEGNGFEYENGNNLLFEGALMYGNSQFKICDAARGSNQNYQDSSFKIIQPFYFKILNADSLQGVTQFNDDNAGTNKFGITTKLESYSFSAPPDNNYIILKYNFTNNSSSNISNFYAGLFFDWDLVDGQNDYAAYNNQNNFGYVYHTGFKTWVATALISSTDYNYWAILNDGSDSSNGGFSIYDGFTLPEKWKALSSGIGKAQAGPGDISEVTSGGPYSIQAGQTLTVAFAIAAGESLSDLSTAIQNAKNKYQSILSNNFGSNNIIYYFKLEQNYPNPFNPETNINYQLPLDSYVTLKIYDILGREVQTLVSGLQSKGNHTVIFDGGRFASGVYFYKLTAGNYTSVKKMILLK